MKVILILLSFIFVFNAYSDDAICPMKSWKLSTLEFSPKDPYLITVLGFSYGPEAKKFVAKLSGAISRYYYEGSEYNMKVSFFSTYYAQEEDAIDAFKHLTIRIQGNSLQRVVRKEKQVVRFGSSKITKECFEKVFEVENKKI